MLLQVPFDDDTIHARFATPEDRAAAAAAVVAALTLDPPGPAGVVRLDVDLPDGSLEAWTIAFLPDRVRLAPEQSARTALRVRLADLVRLGTGRADAALLHLAGRLAVSGDEGLVVQLGTRLRAPGAPGTVLDPGALVPEAVAEAIAGVPLEHLAAVMAGGFRELVLDEVFQRLPEFLIADKAVGVRLTVAMEVGGRPDGGSDRYVVRVTDGSCDVRRADTPDADEPVDATLQLAGSTFLRLVLGHLDPVRGVTSGQIKVGGNLLKALGLTTVLQIPGS